MVKAVLLLAFAASLATFVGGQASITQYPYLVSIQKNGQHYCTGTLVDKRLVLTSYCTGGDSVRVGSSNWNSGGQIISTSIFVKHRTNNITIIKLDENVVESDSVKVIDLASVQPANGAVAQYAGWGKPTEYGTLSDVTFTAAQATIYQTQQCAQYFSQNSYVRSNITATTICATLFNSGSQCAGDWGAPLVINNQLVGIFSITSPGCASVQPKIYTSIPSIYDWLRGEIFYQSLYV